MEEKEFGNNPANKEFYFPFYNKKFSFPPKIKFDRIKFQRALIICIVVSQLLAHKNDIKNLLNLAEIVAQNKITIEELKNAVNGMTPEKNIHITDYNDFLDEVVNVDLDTYEVENVADNFNLNYEQKDKNILEKLQDAVTPDTIDESENKYKNILQEDLAEIKEKTMDNNVLDERDFGKKIQDAWTGFVHFFGGKSVEENNEYDTMQIIKKYTQFVFYGSTEEGITYNKLTRQSKIDTLNVLKYAYRNMERRYPDFKNELDGDTIYPTLEPRVEILQNLNEKTKNIEQDEKIIEDYLGNYNPDNNKILVKEKIK